MDQVEFGLFDWIDRGKAPLQELYEERLRLLEVADSAGFVGYHLAEHHFTPLGMAPSPALFLSAAAQRTKRIRLGPLGYLLPLYNPLRIIEEVCMLDHISNGRLDLGFGRGVSPYELAYFGIDVAESRSIMDESLAVLIEGLTHKRLNHQGKYFQYHDVPMELQPLQQPYPPLWYPTRALDSIKQAGQQGYNCVTIGPADQVRQNVETYWDTWHAHQPDQGRLNVHVSEPKVGVMRQVLVADTDEEALETAQAAHGDWFHSITKLWHANGDHGPDGHFGWEASVRDQSIIFGSPGKVKEQVEQLLEETGCNYLICAFAWGTLTYEQSLHSMGMFAKEVIPGFAGTNAPIL
jgi:alkanesulfonate monooxygenase SsuD/methylene tetrahydromethanopterin reductase-like flavin-dependent oxidoreductase (luciferase family)